ncbi:MAG: STIV orfB116 family protein, partial [Thermoplasmata archaeon]
ASFIEVEEARRLVAEGFTSAIGHQATAEALTLLLGIPVPVNRVQVFLEPGDSLLAFSLRERLPEGKIITNVEELFNIGFDFLLIRRLS